MNLGRLLPLIARKKPSNRREVFTMTERSFRRKLEKRGMSTRDENGEKSESPADEDDLLQEPTNCCMSGCANCVWIRYAEKLSKTLESSDVDMQKLIMEKVQDPNMRAFLSMELRCRNLIK